MPDGVKVGEGFVEVHAKTEKFASDLHKGVRVAIGTVTGIIAGGLGYAFKSYVEATQVDAKFRASLKATGGVAGITYEHVQALGDQLLNQAGVTHEVTENTAGMLLQFDKIRNRGPGLAAVFDRTVVLAQDLAAKMGTDAPAAALKLGKALQDPAHYLGALSRTGLVFSDRQKEMIKNWEKHGQLARAQEYILAGLEGKFGGVAKAMASTPAGRLEVGMAKLHDALKEVGDVIGPVIGGLATAVGAVASAFLKLSPAGRIAVVTIASMAVAAGTLLSVLGFTLGGGIAAGVAAAVIGLAVLIAKNWKTVRRVTIEVFGAVKSFLAKWGFGIALVLTGGLALVVAVIVKNFDKIKRFALGIWKPIFAVWKADWQAITAVVGAVWNAIKGIVVAGVNLVIDAINLLIKGYNLIPFHKDVPLIPHIGGGPKMLDVGSAGGASFTPAAGATGGFASGVAGWRGPGWKWVGEKGAELVRWRPGGLDVVPHGASVALAGKARGGFASGTGDVTGGVIISPQFLSAPMSPAEMIRELHWEVLTNPRLAPIRAA